MKQLSWSTIPYKQSLPRPITTSHGVYSERAGFLLCVQDTEGRCGLGDVAPLPGFSSDTLEEVTRQWDAVRERLSQYSVLDSIGELTKFSGGMSGLYECAPSLVFGIETSLADLAARRAGVPLARWLNPEAGTEIAINALLHAESVAELRAQAIEKTEAGYRAFKLKVGMGTVDADVERIRAVRDAASDSNIRIDANAGWDESQFRDLCSKIADFNLEFVEQPFPIGQAESARDIAAKYEVRLALDEEAATMESAEWLINQRLCDVIVLKPMMVGGLTGCLRLARLAARSGIGIVFTSAWESDVGLSATLHLAVACGSVSLAAGLSTAGMIADGLVRPGLRIERAKLRISERPGLGLELA